MLDQQRRRHHHRYHSHQHGRSPLTAVFFLCDGVGVRPLSHPYRFTFSYLILRKALF
ncbi:MAG: hypothetical protein KJ069_11360 [Anaerolineae bacterium]|nr:hypothetical protein [Anaerolineae bacterium]